MSGIRAVDDPLTPGRVPPRPGLRPGLRQRWLGFRNSLIGNPAFQRRMARLPFGTRIARGRAQALFDVCAGFVYSQTLLACTRLRLFERLAGEPESTGALAAACGLGTEAMRRLLRAAAALDLTEEVRAELWTLGSAGAVLAQRRELQALIEHHAMVYADLADPVALLAGTQTRPTQLEAFWAYARSEDPASLDPARVEAYSTLMAASQALIATHVLDAYPVARHRHILDAGGGLGAFLEAVAARAPQARLTLLDLPAVCAQAHARLAARHRADRIQVAPGDLRGGGWPAGADLICLVRVLHDHDDAAVLQILRSARAALRSGGTLLIAEPLSAPGAAARVADAYFGLYLLAMGSGRARRRAELAQLLAQAGFRAPRLHPSAQPGLVQVLTTGAAGPMAK